jgi:peptidoglycan/LPS O-acetylase OafA/YrhL
MRSLLAWWFALIVMSNPSHRPEIQGLRTVASLLVAVYHIWLGRVSGGVDVFFVVSGFLITRSLLGQLEREGKVDALKFWARLVQRLFPNALFILLVVLAGTVLFLPQFRWPSTFDEILASTFYFENWQLATGAVDYLARDNAKSPVQHYWALAVQGQFYFLWPWIFQFARLLSDKLKIERLRALRAVFVSLFILSLGYSITRTHTDQAFTYFDTLARIWEFSMGAFLAVWRVPVLGNFTRTWISWLGLLMIVLCGVLLRVSTLFPGYAALWPTSAVALILIAGAAPPTRWSATRLLGSKVLSGFGDVSYAFYLWHWPLLVFVQYFSEKNEVGSGYGLLILLLSALLAYSTTRWLESPIRSSALATTKPFLFGLSLLTPNLLALGLWGGWMMYRTGQTDGFDSTHYPGARVVRPGAQWTQVKEYPVLPSPLEVKDSLPKIYGDGCHQTHKGTEPVSCEYGDPRANEVWALVGGSHSAQWLPTLEPIAKNRHFKIVSFTKSSCRFGLPQIPGKPGTKSYACEVWSSNVVKKLVALKPKFAFMTATIGHGPKEVIPPAYPRRWRQLAELGINVIAIRDNPWFMFDVPECVEKWGRDSSKCSRQRSDVLASYDVLHSRKDIPKNVRFLDFSDYFCQGAVCPPVIGNMLVYRDKHHITTLYASTLTEVLEKELTSILSETKR